MAALDRIDAMCADPQYQAEMLMRPGDAQFVNNYHVLHARRGYVDDRSSGRVRHLKRLWLETDLLTERAEARTVPPGSHGQLLVEERPHQERLVV